MSNTSNTTNIQNIQKLKVTFIISIQTVVAFSNMSLLASNQTDKKSKCCEEKKPFLFCCSNFHLFPANMFHLYQISRKKVCGKKYQVCLSDGVDIDFLVVDLLFIRWHFSDEKLWISLFHSFQNSDVNTFKSNQILTLFNNVRVFISSIVMGLF